MEILSWLDREEDDPWGYDRELVHEGRRWMAGLKTVPNRIVDELITHCCISVDSYTDGRSVERWAINGTGKEMLVHPEQTCRELAALLYPKT